MNLRHVRKQPVIWRDLHERPATIRLQRRSSLPRVPGGGEGTFEIMPDFFEMPDDFMAFFGGREEDSGDPHLGSSSA